MKQCLVMSKTPREGNESNKTEYRNGCLSGMAGIEKKQNTLVEGSEEMELHENLATLTLMYTSGIKKLYLASIFAALSSPLGIKRSVYWLFTKMAGLYDWTIGASLALARLPIWLLKTGRSKDYQKKRPIWNVFSVLHHSDGNLHFHAI